jgi:hypothetical protein
MPGHVSRLATLQESSSTSSSLDGCSLPQLPQQQLQQLRQTSFDGCSDDQQSCASLALNSSSSMAAAAAAGSERVFARPASGRLGSPLARSLPQLQKQGSMSTVADISSYGSINTAGSLWQGKSAGQAIASASPSSNAAGAAGSWGVSMSGMRHHSAPLLGTQSRRVSGDQVLTPSSGDAAVQSAAAGRPGAAKAVNFQRALSRSSSQMTAGGGSSSVIAGRPQGAELVM